MRRKNFDFPNKQLEKIGGWVRVRDEGDKITLSYKQLNDRTLLGTKEITVAVNDFEGTCTFLRAVGLQEFALQETRREKWEFGACEVTIDTWPWIPTFLEVEAPDEEKLEATLVKLELQMENAVHGSVEIAYQKYFDVTDQEIYNWKTITFGPTPKWLEAKRR